MSAPFVKSDLKLFRLRLWSILLFVLTTSTAQGQSPQQAGQIQGTVKGPGGQALPAARIVLSEPNGSAKRNAVTDANGRYVLANILYGTYTLAATLSGYKQSELASIAITSASTIIDFNLASLSLAVTADRLKTGSIGGADKHAPVFIPSGIEGTIAPSGYSAAASAQDVSLAMDRVVDLGEEDLSISTPGQGLPTCLQETDLLAATQTHPESFGPNHDLGIFYLSHGNLLRGIFYLKLASADRPADINTSRALAVAYIRTKQYSDAIDLLQRITEKNSNNAALLRLLAAAYEMSGDRSKSIAEYLRATALDRNEQNQFLSGIGLIRLAAIDEAARLFASATAGHSGSAKLWMGLGIAQGLQQNKVGAVRSLLQAIDQDPEYFPPYSFLTTLYGTSTGFDAQIEKRLETFLVAQPENPVAHYDYAVLLWKKLRLSASTTSLADIESQLKFATAKDPTLARAHFQLGVVYVDSGDYDNAAKEFQETVKLKPEDAEAHYRLAQVYRRDKQGALADAELQKFQVLKRNGTDGADDLATDVERFIPQLTHQTHQTPPCRQANR